MTDSTSGAAASEPALHLDPVPLGPPDPARAEVKAVRGQALLSLAFLAGSILLGILIVVGLVVANVVLWNLGRISAGLVILAVVAVVGLGRALLASLKRPADDPGEVEVPESEEPELHAMVRELAQQVGTRPADRVVVVADVNAYVHEYGPLLGLLKGRRTLAIGTPLFDALDVSQLRSVLGHELGHFAGGDTKSGPIVYRTSQVVLHLAQSLRGGALSSLFVRLWMLQFRTTAPARRRQELIADQHAVAIAGRQATADALARVEVTARAQQVFHGRVLGPLVRAGRRPDDFAASFRAVLGERKLIDELAALARSDETPADPLASHPPTRERIARIAALPDTRQVEPDPRRCGVLLRKADHWAEVAAAAMLRRAGVPQPLQPAPATEWPEVIAVPQLDAQVTAVDNALAQLAVTPGIAGLRGVISARRGPELAGALSAGGWHADGADAATTLLRQATMATLARRALDRGATVTLSPSGEFGLLAPDGTPVDLRRWADDALAGQWDEPAAALGLDQPMQAPPAVVTEQQPRPAGSLPVPPIPPFEPADAPWQYAFDAPSRVGATKRWLVSPEGVSLDGKEVRFADVASFCFKIEGAAVGSAVSGRVFIHTRDGAKVRSAGGGMSAATRDKLLAGIAYLWDVMAAMAGPHLRTELVARVDAGEEVDVAGVRVTRTGVGLPKQTPVPWRSIGAVIVADGAVVIPAGDQHLTVPMATENSFVLPGLINELRVRYLAGGAQPDAQPG